jgi:hypothetical protein
MSGLFSTPLKWSQPMVSTWPRFWTFAVVLTAIVGGVVYSAAFEGWRAALGMAIFSAAFQVMLLYALRRLFLQITEHQK